VTVGKKTHIHRHKSCSNCIQSAAGPRWGSAYLRNGEDFSEEGHRHEVPKEQWKPPGGENRVEESRELGSAQEPGFSAGWLVEEHRWL
jgi:hypothetical protein